MSFGKVDISAKDLAEQFVQGVLKEMDGAKPPSFGDRARWTAAVKKVLKQNAVHSECEGYAWLLDFVWWSRKNGTEQMVLAVESELDKRVEKEIEPDFQKLPTFKCPLKLLVFSANVEDTRKMAEDYLQRFTQHVDGEEYLLVGFVDPYPQCWWFRVIGNGRLEPDTVKFIEIQLSKAAVAGSAL
jgi:hypothetical protein